MKKTLTLIELIIAITLMGIVIMGGMSIYYSGQEIFTSSDRKLTVLNDFAYVVEMIHKDVSMASGDASNPGISLDLSNPGSKKGIVIRQDISKLAFPGPGDSNNTPFDYSDDRVIVYWFYSFNWIIIDDYIGPGGEDMPSKCWIDLGGANPFGLVLRDGGVEIQNLAFRFDPTKPADPHDNPEVTSIDLNGNSTLFFAPNYSF